MRWKERREDAGMRGKKSHVEKRNDARGKSAHEKIGYLKTDENGAMHDAEKKTPYIKTENAERFF